MNGQSQVRSRVSDRLLVARGVVRRMQTGQSGIEKYIEGQDRDDEGDKNLQQGETGAP